MSSNFLVKDFPRVTSKVRKKVKLHGASNVVKGNSKTNLGSVMNERGKSHNAIFVRAESASRSNDSAHHNCRPLVSSHLPKLQGKRKQSESRDEESISTEGHMRSSVVLNPVSVVHPSVPYHCGNFAFGQYFMAPQFCHLNNYLVYCNFPNAVLQHSLSRKYFHRGNKPDQQRNSYHTDLSGSGNFSINGLRSWETLTSGDNKPGFTFTVMTYNVLAQELVEQHNYLYSTHKSQALDWSVRWKNLFGEIKKFSPEVLCLQEVQVSHIERYFSRLNTLGYTGIYKKRTGARPDGCAIYYKHDLVNVIEHTTVEYNQPNVSILNRDNVAIIAKFAPKNHPTEEFVVATTHLLYNPKRQDVRLAQTQLLMAEIDRIAFRPSDTHCYLPVILTGDLNSAPNSALYKFITSGQVNYEHLVKNGVNAKKTLVPSSLRITDQCQHADLISKRQVNQALPRSEELKLIELKHSERECEEKKDEKKSSNVGPFSSGTLSHEFNLRSVYDHVRDGDPEGTTFQNEWISVDYIFYSKMKHQSDKLTLLERYRLPTRRQLGDMKIPNRNLGSDHLSLLAKFKLLI